MIEESSSDDNLLTDFALGDDFAAARTRFQVVDFGDDTDPGISAVDLDIVPGTRIGDFEVLEELGAGGMGIVVKAVDTVLDRLVAIKIIAPSIAWNEAMVQRFIREARAMASIDHPAVMQILHWGRHQGLPYFVMPYTEGRTLHQVLRKTESVSTDFLISVAKEVTRAIGAVHDAGLIHRDLKPSNIWIEDETGAIKILDFGLVQTSPEESEADGQLTQVGMLTGTPGFMAPEQVLGEAVTSRTDLFSLGAMLYAAIAGRPPFWGKTPNAAAVATATLPFERLSVTRDGQPAGLIDLVHQCLMKAPEQRPQSADEILERLEQIQAAGSRRRHRLIRSLALVATMMVMLGGWTILTSSGVTGDRVVDPEVSQAGLGQIDEVTNAEDEVGGLDANELPNWLTPEQRDALVQRPAAVKILTAIGREESKGRIRSGDAILIPLIVGLQHREDPTLRSDLIHLAPDYVSVDTVMGMLTQDLSPDVAAATVQMLGGYQSVFSVGADADQRLLQLRKRLLRLCRRCSTAELQSSCRWLWKQLGQPNCCDELPRLEDLPFAFPKPTLYQPLAGPTMVAIPTPGLITIGSPPTEVGRNDAPEQSEDLRSLALNYPLAVSITEITVGQMRALLPEAIRENVDVNDAWPVRGISWGEAAEYCNRLSEQNGLPESQFCYDTYMRDGRWLADERADAMSRGGYRMLHDDEWEYVCRGGTRTIRYFGSDATWFGQYAVVGAGEDSDDADLEPVATRKPNPFGLFDMLGNISVWTNDRNWIDSTRHRRVRGGSVFTAHDGVRSAARYNVNERMWPPHHRIGLRVARTLP